MAVTHELTYVAADGTRKPLSYVTGHALTRKRERFCELVAYGAVPIDAYIEAYEKPPITNDVDRRYYQQLAGQVLADTDVKVRIQELRRPIQRKLAKKWEYTLDQALEDCQRAWDVAHADGDSKSMQACIRLRAELTKLLKQDVTHTHNHMVLDEETTEVLVALRDAVRRKKSAVKIVSGESGAGKGNGDAGPPSPPLLL
jgi:hypothetical protein